MSTDHTAMTDQQTDAHARYVRAFLRDHWGIGTYSVRWVNRAPDHLAEVNVFDLEAVEVALDTTDYTVTEVRNTRASIGLK